MGAVSPNPAFDRIFDYSRQEFAEPIWTTGGNPLLGRGTQSSLSLSMTVRPFTRHELALNLGYRQFVANDSPAAFPDLTPAIEAAFPERVVRDGAGRLLSIDARPINIERQKDANLSSSATLRLGGKSRRGPGVMPINLAADPPQINLALSYQLRLRSESLIRHGLPVIDRLANSGTSRHALDLQIGVGKRAFGGNLGGSWNSATRVTGPNEIFHLKPPMMLSLSSFLNMDRLIKGPRGGNTWAHGLKVSLDVQNLLNGYPKVVLQDRSVPVGYSRDEVDPLGRTVRLSLRKMF